MNEDKKIQRLPAIDSNIHKDFKVLCALKGVKLKYAAEEAIQDYLKKHRYSSKLTMKK